MPLSEPAPDIAAGKHAVASGQKYRTRHGSSAIKDGIKVVNLDASGPVGVSTAGPGRRSTKPPWLRVRLASGGHYADVRRAVRDHKLATVCEESHCPNIGECWSAGTATIMLMGDVCTRACRFCAVDTGNPRGFLDPEEPANAAETVRLMGLKYVVLTSVDRDDLADGGANHYAACIREIKSACPTTTVEALTPDFAGSTEAVETVVRAGVDVFAQNLETVERLTKRVRDPRAGYRQTLRVLAHAKTLGVVTKTSLMLGLGETDAEIRSAFADLRAHDVDLVTLGQYLQPTRNHLPVDRWVHPTEFEQYRTWALDAGFVDMASGPLVRSSYRADELARAINRPSHSNTAGKRAAGAQP